jgi:hypothetical protein
MTFSLRTSLIVTSILACWLGALVSKSATLVELVACATALLIFLTLAFAIWDSRPDQRAFWTGFFVLAFGNLLLAHYFNAYQQTGNEVATRIMGPPNAPNYGPMPTFAPAPMLGPGAYSPPVTSFYQPPDPATASITYAVQLPANPNDYYQQLNSIRMAVPNLLSLLAGVIGGWLTLWISRQARNGATQTVSSTTPG